MGFSAFVPGHGPAGDLSDVDMLKKYITTLQQLVSQAVGASKTLEETLQLKLPEPFDAWQVKNP